MEKDGGTDAIAFVNFTDVSRWQLIGFGRSTVGAIEDDLFQDFLLLVKQLDLRLKLVDLRQVKQM